MYTDKQYWILFKVIYSDIKVTDMPGLDDITRRWVYNKKSSHKYRVADMYHVRSPATAIRLEDRQYGRVLVNFPKADENTGEFSHTDMRRVISYSQITQALDYCHVSGTGHRGMDATEALVTSSYCGISRGIIRQYVDRCTVCQSKRRQQYKAPLQPIITNHRCERFLIDLIDFQNYPDGDYCWIMQLADHKSRFRWARPLVNKESASVAAELEPIFSTFGGPQILQSDNGREFKGEVTALCDAYRVRQVFSRPYHPQTNGLIERGQGTLKMMIRKYQEANQTNRWAACLGRAILQINTTHSRVIRMTPYELVFGARLAVECVPVCNPSLILESMEDVATDNSSGQAIDLTVSESPILLSPSPSPSEEKTSADEVALIDQSVQRDDLMRDVGFQQTAPLGTLSAKLFNVGHKFYRFGAIGGGRCCACAVELAVTNCVWTRTVRQMEDHLDVRRKDMHTMVSGWSNAERTRWSQMMFDLGMSDGQTGDRPIDDVRSEIIKDLLVDLSCPTAGLGWEYLVCAHVKFHVNIIVIPILAQRNRRERWEGDQEPIIEQCELGDIGIVRIPYQMNPHFPFIIIYQRSEYENYIPCNGRESCMATSTGHYEVVCWKDPTTNVLTSYFELNHPAYPHLQRLFRHEVAAHASWVARQQMVDTYDSNVHVRRFNRLEAAGLRTNTVNKKRGKKKPIINVPALIIEVIEDPRDHHRPSRHPMYRLLTRHGLIDGTVKADGLVSLSENNHIDLFNTLRGWATDALQGPQSFLAELETRAGKVSIERSAEMEIEDRESAPLRLPARQQPPRAAAVSEEKKDEENSEGKEMDEPLFAVGQSHPIRIVSRSGRRYRVEWSDPPGELTWEPENKVHSTELYRVLLVAWRAQQPEQEEEANPPPTQRRRLA
jgi:transposase InsO family protein